MCVCVYPSLQHPDSSLSSEHVPLRAAVVSSLSEASPEALDHHSGSILALLQVWLHLVWTNKHRVRCLKPTTIPPVKSRTLNQTSVQPSLNKIRKKKFHYFETNLPHENTKMSPDSLSLWFPSIHPLIFFRFALGGGAEAYPSCLNAKGRVHPGLVPSLSQGIDDSFHLDESS